MMEDKLISKLIKKEINNLDENKLPPSVELKLNKAYETIRNDEINIKEGNENIKNTKKHNKNKYVMAASITICLLTIVSFNPVLAEKIPVLKEMSHYLKDIYWVNENYINNANEINITQEDQGIEIDLQGVVYDESSIKFIYTLSSEKKLQWGVQMRNSSLKINNKELLISDEVSDERKFSDETKISKEDDKIEKYAVVTTYDISDIKLDDNVEISWTPKEIHIFDGVYAKGDWKFDFKISKEALKSTSKVFDTNYVIEKDGYKNIIEKIIFTPVETKVVIKHDGKINQDLAKAYLELENDPQNKEKQEQVEKLNKIDDELSIFRYYIINENGEELKSLTGKGYSNENGGRSISIYQPVKEIPQKLSFTQLNRKKEKATEVPLKDFKTPFEFKQGENMSITVNSIENNNGNVKMNVTFNGNYAASRLGDNPIIIVPPNLGESDGIYGYDKKISKNNPFENYLKADKNNNPFEFDFEIDPLQDYVVRFNVMYDKVDGFSIDLNK